MLILYYLQKPVHSHWQ